MQQFNDSFQGFTFIVEKKIKNEILTCAACSISVHESIALQKNKKSYCSQDCLNS